MRRPRKELAEAGRRRTGAGDGGIRCGGANPATGVSRSSSRTTLKTTVVSTARRTAAALPLLRSLVECPEAADAAATPAPPAQE